MEHAWKWVVGGAALVLGYFFFVRKSEPEAGDLCVAAFPEPFKGDANKAIAAGDVAHLESFARQADARGWHCGATELRAEAKQRGSSGVSTSPADLSLADIPKEQREAWGSLLHRSSTESGGELAESLGKAADEAKAKGWTKVEHSLRDARAAVAKRVAIIDVTEVALVAEFAAAREALSHWFDGDESSDDSAHTMDDLATSLEHAGYETAAAAARKSAGEMRGIDACLKILDRLPTDPFQYFPDPDKKIRSVRLWAKGIYNGHDPSPLGYAVEAMAIESSGLKAAGHATQASAYTDAIACMRGKPVFKYTYTPYVAPKPIFPTEK